MFVLTQTLGARVIGPFETREAAHIYRDGLPHDARGRWYVIELSRPTAQ